MAKLSNKAKTQKEEKTITTENRAKHVLKGRIVAATLPRTVTVLVERKKMHPLYGKSYVSSKKYLVHTEQELVLGDVVEIAQIRPMSKNKYFAVTKVVGRNIEAVIAKQLKEETAQKIAEILPADKEKIVVEENTKVEEEVKIEKPKRQVKKTKEEKPSSKAKTLKK